MQKINRSVLVFAALLVCEACAGTSLTKVFLPYGVLKFYVPASCSVAKEEGPDFDLIRLSGPSRNVLIYVGRHPKLFLAEDNPGQKLNGADRQRTSGGKISREIIRVLPKGDIVQAVYLDIDPKYGDELNRVLESVDYEATLN